MKKLRLFALYALVTPAMALGTGSLLAEQHSTQSDQSEQLSETSEQLSDTADKLSDTAGELSDTAEQSSATSDQDVGHEQQRAQSDQEDQEGQEVTISVESTEQDVGQAYDGENVDESAQSSAKATQSGQDTDDPHGMKNHGYMESAPANGMQANHLIGAEVKTSGDEDVGSVSDLIVDKNGQVVAIVLGIGGFLGMGEKEVAIGWDDVTRSGTSDDLELRIDATRASLGSAPEFKAQD